MPRDRLTFATWFTRVVVVFVAAGLRGTILSPVRGSAHAAFVTTSKVVALRNQGFFGRSSADATPRNPSGDARVSFGSAAVATNRGAPAMASPSSSSSSATTANDEIVVVHQPDENFLRRKGVFDWGTWGCGVSKFPWTYDAAESCYLLAGEVTVTPADGRQPATFGKVSNGSAKGIYSRTRTATARVGCRRS
jgi:uncharacterized cupin superfamily protein